jgi:hypothetical protein
LLHQRYKDFSSCLVQGLLKVFFPGKSGDDLDADKNSRAMKKRSTLKLLIELYFVGIVEDASIFVNVIKDLTSAEHLKDREATQTNLSLLSTFARQGRVFVGLQSQGQEAYDEVRKNQVPVSFVKSSKTKVLEKYMGLILPTSLEDLGVLSSVHITILCTMVGFTKHSMCTSCTHTYYTSLHYTDRFTKMLYFCSFIRN